MNAINRVLLVVTCGVLALLLFWLMPSKGQGLDEDSKLVIFAAASTTDLINELALQYDGDVDIRCNFASSSVLARQIEAGAPADIYISANLAWMDYLQDRQLVNTNSRMNLCSNSLVLVVPIDSPLQALGAVDELSPVLTCRIALGDPEHVPAGIYAAEALASLGLYEQVREHMVAANSVRNALVYIEQQQVDCGIVYLTDAIVSEGVRVIFEFPAETHGPIQYTIAMLPDASENANRFFEFLQSNQAQQAIERHGFSPLVE